MVLRPSLAERPVDSNTSKMYILENRVSSGVFTSTIPYLSNNKEVECCKSPSPTTAGKSGRSRVSFQDDVDQECCVFDRRFAPKGITKRQSSSKSKVTQTTSGAPLSFLNSKVFVKRLNNAAIKIQAQARRVIQSKRYLRILISKVEKEIDALYEKVPKGITKRQSSSKSKVTQTTSGAPLSFLNSKVFVKKLNNAAIKIQAQARRVIQSKKYLRILISKVEKEIDALYEKAAAMKFEAAATAMQAFGRGVMCRMHFQITKVEFRLLQSDRLQKAQLEDIQKDKERQMEAVCDETTKKIEKTEKKDNEKDIQDKMNKTDKKDKTKKNKRASKLFGRKGKLPKVQDDDSLTSLDISHNGSSCSLDASSDSWCQDYAKYDSKNWEYDIGSLVFSKQAEQLRMMKVEEEHTRKRGERLRGREEAKKKSMSEVEVTRGDIFQAHRDDRLERVFLWYRRLAVSSRKEFKRQIAAQEWIDITAEDVDLLTWNKTGTRVVNMSTLNAMIRTRTLKESKTKVPAS
jgi:protein involved in ribonucleotide reduction